MTVREDESATADGLADTKMEVTKPKMVKSWPNHRQSDPHTELIGRGTRTETKTGAATGPADPVVREARNEIETIDRAGRDLDQAMRMTQETMLVTVDLPTTGTMKNASKKDIHPGSDERETKTMSGASENGQGAIMPIAQKKRSIIRGPNMKDTPSQGRVRLMIDRDEIVKGQVRRRSHRNLMLIHMSSSGRRETGSGCRRNYREERLWKVRAQVGKEERARLMGEQLG